MSYDRHRKAKNCTLIYESHCKCVKSGRNRKNHNLFQRKSPCFGQNFRPHHAFTGHRTENISKTKTYVTKRTSARYFKRNKNLAVFGIYKNRIWIWSIISTFFNFIPIFGQIHFDLLISSLFMIDQADFVRFWISCCKKYKNNRWKKVSPSLFLGQSLIISDYSRTEDYSSGVSPQNVCPVQADRDSGEKWDRYFCVLSQRFKFVNHLIGHTL